MQGLFQNLKVFVAALLFVSAATFAFAQDARLDPLFERLGKVGPDDAPLLERKIILEWSKSGSASMDYLLRRAREDFEKEDWDGALVHLTALTDHAPDFAEGWHAKSLAHFHRGELGLAMDGIERSLAIEPRHFQAMGGLMAILETLDQNVEALRMGQLIQSIHPHFDGLSEAIARLEGKTQGQAL